MGKADLTNAWSFRHIDNANRGGSGRVVQWKVGSRAVSSISAGGVANESHICTERDVCNFECYPSRSV